MNVDSVDRLNELLTKSSAIAELIRSASLSDDQPYDGALSNAAWAVEGMLHEAKGIIGGATIQPEAG